MNNLISILSALYAKHGVASDEVNIFGVEKTGASALDDKFQDVLGINVGDEIHFYRGVTEPSKYYTVNPITYKGITGGAHLKLGYHHNIWMVGIHAAGTGFAHEALLQTGNAVTIIRDIDKDGIAEDNEPEQRGYFGINFHRAHPSAISDSVGLYGAGCQVMQNPESFIKFMNLLKGSDKYKKNVVSRFSYLLLKQEEFPEAFENL